MYEATLGARFTVLTAKKVEDGYVLFATHPDIALVVMDGCVPGTQYNTGGLARDIRAMRPVPIVATSNSHRAEQMEDGCTHQSSKSGIMALAPTILGLPPITRQALAEFHGLRRPAPQVTGPSITTSG